MAHQQQRRYVAAPRATTSKSNQIVKAGAFRHFGDLIRTTVPRPNVQDMNALVGTNRSTVCAWAAGINV